MILKYHLPETSRVCTQAMERTVLTQVDIMAEECGQDMSDQFDHVFMLVYGALKSKILATACELGIFEELSSERLTAKAISEKLSTNEAATAQLLDALVSLKLLGKHCGEEPPCYSNTQATEKYLLKSSPDSIRGFALYLDQMVMKVFDNLPWAIREGTNQYQRTFGHTSSSELNPFNSLYAAKEDRISFLDAMRGSIKHDASLCISAFDLDEFNHMCDLGGGTGDIAYTACKAYPKMKITVLDLPSIVEVSSRFKPSIDECPNQGNVSFFAGDFFADELPSADLYVLTRILHDWDEEKINLLLSKIFKSLPSGGGLLIGEILLRDDKTGPLIGNIHSLIMLNLCSRGARERSGLEYRDLLETRGFVQVQTKVIPGSITDGIFAKKP